MAATRNVAKACSIFATCVDMHPFTKRVLACQPEQLAPDNTKVELDIMTDKIFRLCRRIQKNLQDISERLAHLHRVFRRDSMHNLCFNRNDEAVRTNDMVMRLNKLPKLIVQLPR